MNSGVYLEESRRQITKKISSYICVLDYFGVDFTKKGVKKPIYWK